MSVNPREASLPKWAQEELSTLRYRLRLASEAFERKLTELVPQVNRLQHERDALIELLQAASRGKHLMATEILEILASFELTPKEQVKVLEDIVDIPE